MQAVVYKDLWLMNRTLAILSRHYLVFVLSFFASNREVSLQRNLNTAPERNPALFNQLVYLFFIGFTPKDDQRASSAPSC